MTDTRFYNWQKATAADRKKYDRPSPNLVALRGFVLRAIGGQNLGLYGPRPVRGGSAPSSHSFGAAWDWRYQDVNGAPLAGASRAEALDLAATIIDAPDLFGVQAIHDYVGCRIWHLDRPADEDPDGDGWRDQRRGSGGGSMGARWAGYFHFETTRRDWADDRPIESRLGFDDDTPEVAAFLPEARMWGLFPTNPRKATLRVGSTGDLVRYAQGVLTAATANPGPIDGRFGVRTASAVVTFQGWHNVKTDGIVGPITWALLDQAARDTAAR